MLKSEIEYAAKEHRNGKPMAVISNELNYSENTLWYFLKKSGLDYKNRKVSRVGIKSEEYKQGWRAGYIAGYRAQQRKEGKDVSKVD